MNIFLSRIARLDVANALTVFCSGGFVNFCVGLKTGDSADRSKTRCIHANSIGRRRACVTGVILILCDGIFCVKPAALTTDIACRGISVATVANVFIRIVFGKTAWGNRLHAVAWFFTRIGEPTWFSGCKSLALRRLNGASFFGLIADELNLTEGLPASSGLIGVCGIDSEY